MSRAHVQGFDSNAAQFERMGNPWVSERDRCEFSAPSKRERRQNRNGAKPKVDLGNFPKPRPERASREGDPIIRQMQKSSNFLARFKSGLPGGTIDTVGLKPEERYLDRGEPVRLTADQLEKRRQQRVAMQERREDAERAYAASEAGRVAEKRRLEAMRVALEARIANL
jgi:hypothetical protein